MASRRFENFDPAVRKRPLKDVLKWALERRAHGAIPSPCPAQPYPQKPIPENCIRIAWIGHSTLLIEASGGPTILTDPVFSDRCFPVGFAGPRRFHPPGIALAELPQADAVLISHNHYDHLDRRTINKLLGARGEQPLFIVPAGLGGWFARAGAKRIRELNWFEEHHGGNWSVTAVPAQHWSQRAFVAPNSSWWCGYRMEFGCGKSMLFAGDSGYFQGFQMIGERWSRTTVAALPIGAYEPRWFMKSVHMTPEEAVQAFHDVHAETFLAIHHNTFRLTDEPPDEPERRLRVAWERSALSAERLWIPLPGDYQVF